MKKIYIAMLVLATMALVSCEQQEQSFDDVTPLGENDIAFYIPVSSTRAEAVQDETEIGNRIEVGTDDNGHSLFLKETIEYLNPGPATRGVPAYTENLGKVYTTMGVYTPSKGSGDATFSLMDETATESPADGKGWRYRKQYDGKYDPWVDETTAADFYLRMPASQSGVSSYAYDGGTIAFNYDASSLQKGDKQQDILFAFTSINKKTHDGYLPKGAPVMMYHALTGVKFRVGNDNTGTTKTIIRSVEISGLKDAGHCVINPSGNGTVTWTEHKMIAGSFKLDYKDYKYGDASETGDDNTIDYVKPTEGDAPFGNSWYTGKTGIPDMEGNSDEANAFNAANVASKKNLNDEDGSLTFWFIPQEMTDDVILKVTFCVKTTDTAGDEGGGMITHTINFGKKLSGVEWKAGELRTYTLEPEDVDVDIFDSLSGFVKNNLHVTNTGNVDEYVRMMLMGNWYGWLPDQDPSTDQPSMLVGYTSADTGNETMVDNWFGRKEPYSLGFDETFTGGKPSGDNPWIFGTGSYYYYPTPIGAGEKLAETATLFQSYELDPTWIPDIYIPVGSTRQKAKGVHLVFECVVQAISAKDANGTPYADWKAAWSAATGETIDVK